MELDEFLYGPQPTGREVSIEPSARGEQEEEDLGSALAMAREDAGLTQAQLAEAAHVPAGRVGDWEQGTRPLSGIKFATAKRLADALGVSLDYLWTLR